MEQTRSRFCRFCNGSKIDDDVSHETSPLHKLNVILFNWNENRKALVRDRHGIEITISLRGVPLSHDINRGKHSYPMSPQDLVRMGNNLDFKCTITNRRTTSIYITYANVLLPYTWFSFHNENNNNGRRIELKAGSSYSVIVKFCSGETTVIGSYNIPVCFSFQTLEAKPNIFSIVRAITILVQENLLPGNDNESPFTGNPWPVDFKILPPTRAVFYSNMYPIPIGYENLLRWGIEKFRGMTRIEEDLFRLLRIDLNPGYVTLQNYKRFWDIILWLEEVTQVAGLQQYNMENVTLTLIPGSKLELFVPGLAEKRPSVIVGDMVDIRIHEGDHTGYRGIINRVNDNTVEIGDINDEFITIMELKEINLANEVDVKFVLSRLSFERQHHGVNNVVNNNVLPYLFPPDTVAPKNIKSRRTIADNEFYNDTIAQNQEQKMAVINILNMTSAPYPYIVFGPPGTGKTVTIVEAILQLKKKTKHHILICAPSNAACDVITEKLLPHCTKKELLRIMSETVDMANVHEIILPYTNYEKDDKMFRKIVPEDLSDFRIIVTTLILAGRYSNKYHPDIVFIDEAAQAHEPEACCALGLLHGKKPIVLAGDPMQLGPSLSSEVAVNYGLGISLLERLMECEFYKKNDPNYITMLVQNFRNHEMILHLPNKLFYKGKLKPKSIRSHLDPVSNIFIFEKIQELYKNKKKKKKSVGKPIEFCSLISRESREGKSPSYYNVTELQMTIKYIQALLALTFKDDKYCVLQTDIGVVTPYVRQVHKLKQLLKQHGFNEVEVGTTETFQGREKRIIIISTVRAQEDLLLYDKKYSLGFVKHEKRFNVAMTRAMSKLIVIGCAHVLATDDKWLEYIELCEEVNGFCGAPFSRRTDDVVQELSETLKNVKVDTQYNPNDH